MYLSCQLGFGTRAQRHCIQMCKELVTGPHIIIHAIGNTCSLPVVIKQIGSRRVLTRIDQIDGEKATVTVDLGFIGDRGQHPIAGEVIIADDIIIDIVYEAADQAAIPPDIGVAVLRQRRIVQKMFLTAGCQHQQYGRDDYLKSILLHSG